MKKIVFLFGSVVILFACCSTHKQGSTLTTIDSTLQAQATAILDSELTRWNVEAGQVMVMETRTGHILAMTRLEKVDSAEYVPSETFDTPQPSGLFRAVSLLAMLESGKIQLDDTLDTGHGIYIVNGDTIRDHSFYIGGYGVVDLLYGTIYNSDVAIVKGVQKAFSDSTDYYKGLEKLGYEPCDGSCGGYLYHALGHHKTTQQQILEFFNAIANDGTMLKAQMENRKEEVLNEQIASQESIDSLKLTFLLNITHGLGKSVKSDSIAVAGLGYTLGNASPRTTTFCGYVPAEEPQYTIIVTFEKNELPIGVRMPGTVFKEIAEYLMTEFQHKEQ